MFDVLLSFSFCSIVRIAINNIEICNLNSISAEATGVHHWPLQRMLTKSSELKMCSLTFIDTLISLRSKISIQLVLS